MERDLSSVKVSVIVPVYNAEKYVSKCFDSLVNQSLKDIEIIVIDDGSTDKTQEIVKDYANKDGRIKIITQTNQKQGAARNRGLEIAQGEYVTFVDADDWIDGDYLEKMYKAVKKYNVNSAISSMRREKKNRSRWHIKFNEEKLCYGLNEILEAINLHLEAGGRLYKFSEIKDLRFAENSYWEDGFYTIQALYKEKSLIIVPDVVYHYFSNPGSTIKKKQTIKSIKDLITARMNIINFAEEKGIKLLNKVIYKERRGLFTIKHFKHRKDYYFGGIKIFSREKVFNEEDLKLCE